MRLTFTSSCHCLVLAVAEELDLALSVVPRCSLIVIAINSRDIYG